MVSGFNLVHVKLKQVTNRIKQDSRRELRKIVGDIEVEAKEQVPVDTGFLMNSFYVQELVTKNNFGLLLGNSAGYAFKVHEDLNVKFKKGNAKYLENAIIKYIPELQKIGAKYG